MPLVASTTLLVCWKVPLGVITAPSFLQVTVVAGPPVEVQVRALDCLSNVSSVMLGAPTYIPMSITVNESSLVFHHQKGSQKCIRRSNLVPINVYALTEKTHDEKLLFSM